MTLLDEIMGVKIKDILEVEEIKIDDLNGKTLVVDAMNVLYQFLSSIRQYDGTPLMDSKGNITSHLSGVFYRITNLIEKGLDFVFVFDGKSPEFKKLTQKKRIEKKEEAERKWKEAIEKEDFEEAKKYAQATSRLSSEMIEETKELLDAMGINYVVAPSEGEAQAAYMAKTDSRIYGVLSQDLDSLLFGAPVVVRNVSVGLKKKIPGTKQYVSVSPERIVLDKSLKNMEISQDQLIMIGILVGTDYNEGGVKGIGAKKALKLVKKYENMEDLLENIEWNFDVDFLDLFYFFKEPPVTNDYNIEVKKINEDKIKDILVERHEFSENRIENTIEKLKKAKERKKQRSLFNW